MTARKPEAKITVNIVAGAARPARTQRWVRFWQRIIIAEVKSNGNG